MFIKKKRITIDVFDEAKIHSGDVVSVKHAISFSTDPETNEPYGVYDIDGYSANVELVYSDHIQIYISGIGGFTIYIDDVVDGWWVIEPVK
ncbi:hypothetical protein SDC9_52638 [bioreactor metagenome]|uniref:Uncharacterized protein n=1 Tax=bioreactor metagenome TaxID=1076179 RepID=A0A644WRL2_9ZZZZ